MAKIKKQNKDLENKLKKNILFCVILFILVLLFSYFIFMTDILKPSLNQITASYISFNNSNSTDMLKISNLKRMSDEKGESTVNSHSVDIKITGKKNSFYDIILYSTNNKIDAKNIKFYLERNGNELVYNTLDRFPNSDDGGVIIYQGKVIKREDFHLRMWLTDNYHGNTNNLSFEVKIKAR